MFSFPNTPKKHSHHTIAKTVETLLKETGAEIHEPTQKTCGTIVFTSIYSTGTNTTWEFLPEGKYQITLPGKTPKKFNPLGIAGLIDRLHNTPQKTQPANPLV